MSDLSDYMLSSDEEDDQYISVSAITNEINSLFQNYKYKTFYIKGEVTNYRDPKTHEVNHLQDPGGWSCKVGYYGRGREPDKVYYHCAGSWEPRLTLGYVVPHLGLWQSMVADISGESADHLS